MVTCELSRVGCCLKRRQQQISTCRSQEGGKSLSRVENDPRRLSQKVKKNRHSESPPPPPGPKWPLWEKTTFIIYLVGPFLVHKLLGPRPPHTPRISMAPGTGERTLGVWFSVLAASFVL